MDKHLMYLVKQTERYTNIVAENMKSNLLSSNDPLDNGLGFDHSVDSSPVPSRKSSSRSKPAKRAAKQANAAAIRLEDADDVNSPMYITSSDDEEFVMNDSDEEPDDETTLIEEEARGATEDRDAELATLKADAEMSIEELRAKYAALRDVVDDESEGTGENSSEAPEDNDGQGADEGSDDAASSTDEEYEPDEADDLDDETTLIEEEAKAGTEDRDAELAQLKSDADMSIEELRAKYANLADFSDSDDDDADGDNSEDNEEAVGVEGLQPAARTDGRSSRSHPVVAAEENTGGDSENESSDEEFVVVEDEEELDDETTLIEEEARGELEDRDAELATLKADADMSIEELRAKYANMPADEDTYDDEDDEEDHEEAEDDDAGTKPQKLTGTGMDVEEDDVESESDEDFVLSEGAEELDDETTLIEEEARGGLGDRDMEIAELKADAEMSIEELRAKYANMPMDEEEEEDGYEAEENEDESVEEVNTKEEVEPSDVTARQVGGARKRKSSRMEVDKDAEAFDYQSESDEEFVLNEVTDELDDETTLIEEEAKGSHVDRDTELAELKADADLDISELRAKYASMPAYDDDLDGSEASDDEAEGGMEMEVDDSRSVVSTAGSTGRYVSSKQLAELDRSLRSVHVLRPFLLSPRLVLREYQHKGLNWLVSLYQRRLNGILAE
jgi:3-phenylpropionate/cinnamic acid dioxygenase small subunit